MNDLNLVLPPTVFARLVDEVTARVRAELATEREQDTPRWLTLEQAGNRLGCSPDAVRMRVNRGRLEHRKQGRRIYVSARSVDELAS